MTTATDTPDARAVYDLAMRLSPEERDRLVGLLTDPDLPPPPDDAAFAAELRRRVEQVAAGAAVTLSRAEAEDAVRQALRAQGVEL